jgi:hypothetical protein
LRRHARFLRVAIKPFLLAGREVDYEEIFKNVLFYGGVAFLIYRVGFPPKSQMADFAGFTRKHET